MQTKEVLPIGWKLMKGVVGDPSDAGTPEEEWEETNNPEHPRKEVRYWYRGDRYVRICYCEADPDETNRYTVRTGLMEGKDGDLSVKGYYGNLQVAIIKAKVVMRIGGY